MTLSEVANVESEPLFKNGSDTLFVDLDCDGWARSPFSVD